MNEVISIISIFCEEILLVKKRNHWILPGGKIQENESHKECILRELGQELPQSKLVGKLRYFGKFSGNSPSGKPITVKCYLGDIRGNIFPAAEISYSAWAIREEVFFYNLSEITKNIIKELLARNIL